MVLGNAIFDRFNWDYILSQSRIAVAAACGNHRHKNLSMVIDIALTINTMEIVVMMDRIMHDRNRGM